MSHDEDTYGPRASYSEHKQGDTITYRERVTGETRTGDILYVQAAGTVIEGREPLPLRYVVEHGDDFPDIVFPHEVITSTDAEEDDSQEPILVDCPYCGGMHQKGLQGQCPLKP